MERQRQQQTLSRKFRCSRLYARMTIIMDKSNTRIEKTDKVRLTKWIDKEYPSLSREIARCCPLMKEDHRHLCFLFKVGLNPTEISKLYDVTVQTVSRWRAGLYKELTGTAGSACDLQEVLDLL